ncbi:MAG: DUF5110 domain-containing protein [Bacteroidales bacterium]|nr:DUF5110 domain-containing protein [Bacteroidales bacterium]MBR0037169.1 DUF5110 domain-containing protein [Bacteroidales bacterium]
MYAEIPMQWNDRRHTLTIGRQKGGFDASAKTRQFSVILPDGTSKTVSYSGKTINVKL